LAPLGRRRLGVPRASGPRVGDRVIGITLGILLGLAIVIAFVFFGSGDTIDDPSLSGGEATTQEAPATTAPAPPP
jgi:hypothetical protein